MEYPYFKGLEADRYSFYRVPKALVKADLFQKMSGDAKLLYAVLLDRMSLSIKNGWQDKHGNAYIICTIKGGKITAQILKAALIKLLAEMDKKKKQQEKGKGQCKRTGKQSIGQIPKFDKLIATIRSREISASIILQSQSQLKTIYKDAADTITGNCDCTLFLGGKEKSTLKEISEVLGKETIDLYNTSETRSNNNSYGLNYQKTGKELMSQDEIAVMDGAKCILQLRGVRPFLSNKYDITKHPKYRQLSDYDKRNAFDIEKYRQHKLVVKPDDTFDLYDMGEVEAD